MPAVGINIQSSGNADKFTVSDNYFWLDPGESETVELNRKDNIKADTWNLAGNIYIKTGK